MQPLQYDLRDPAAPDNSITHAAAAPSNLDAATNYNAIRRDWVAERKRTTRNGVGNCSSKTGSRHQSRKKTILKHFFKGFLKGKLLAPKLRKSADKSLSQPGCSHSITIYDLQLQKTIVLRMQPRHQATLTQPLQCVSQHHVANLHVSTHMATPDDNNHAASPMRSATTDPKTPYNYAHTSTAKAAWSAAAPAAHRRYLSSPPAATLHGKIQGFVLRLPPQHKPHATFMQPLQCILHLPSSRSILLWCIVMWCQVSHRPSSMSILLWCIVM